VKENADLRKAAAQRHVDHARGEMIFHRDCRRRFPASLPISSFRTVVFPAQKAEFFFMVKQNSAVLCAPLSSSIKNCKKRKFLQDNKFGFGYTAVYWRPVREIA
jgi:hypothetical protein